jgi:hypothetical protein
MKDQQRNEDELKRVSHHLRYELAMLSAAANAISSGIAERGWLSNLLLESFVLHVRSVSDFFYVERKKEDDALAGDFFLEGQWVNLRPIETDLLKKARKRAHKEVVHLTYERLNVAPEAKPWPLLEIVRDVDAVLHVFLQHVPKQLLNEKWSHG